MRYCLWSLTELDTTEYRHTHAETADPDHTACPTPQTSVLPPSVLTACVCTL